MTQQPTLFDDLYREPLAAPSPAGSGRLARRTDPKTSHEAAAAIVENGADDSQRTKILDLLRLRPATAKELVGLAVNYRQRVTELRRAGHAIAIRKTISAATGGEVNIYVLEGADE